LDIESIKGINPNTDKEETRKPDNSEPFAALAFKIATDPYVGKLCFIRVYSGSLKSGSYVYNSSADQKERIGRIVMMHANHREEIQEVYAGDIAAAYSGGFALSSNQAGLAQLWHPGAPDTMAVLVRMEEAYALASWHGPGKGGGVVVATGLGLVRAHPAAPPVAIPWPKPMALDNHWVLLGES